MDEKLSKELQDSFIKNLNSILEQLANNDGDIDEILAGQCNSEEEKRLIEDICSEIDLEHDLMEDLMNSGLEPEEWYEREMKKLMQ